MANSRTLHRYDSRPSDTDLFLVSCPQKKTGLLHGSRSRSNRIEKDLLVHFSATPTTQQTQGLSGKSIQTHRLRGHSPCFRRSRRNLIDLTTKNTTATVSDSKSRFVLKKPSSLYQTQPIKTMAKARARGRIIQVIPLVITTLLET